MYRQLREPAFFGTDREKATCHPPNGRHYKARGNQPGNQLLILRYGQHTSHLYRMHTKSSLEWQNGHTLLMLQGLRGRSCQHWNASQVIKARSSWKLQLCNGAP
jgi:hypothetical protein